MDPPDSGAADPWAACTLEFGDAPYAIDQLRVTGDRAQAVRQLLAACRQAAARCGPPSQPPDAAERQLLQTVQLLQPLEVSQGVRFYGPDTGLPLLVAVADPDARSEDVPPQPAASADVPAGDQLGASRDRVLVWGIAAPAGQQAWSLYTFRLGEHRAASPADVPSVPLPPGSRRTMALRDAQGVTLMALAGSGTAHEWRQSFAQGFSRTGWSMVQDWQLAADVWHARYARGVAPGCWTVELQFGPDPGGRLSGLVRIVPPAAADGPAGETQREQR